MAYRIADLDRLRDSFLTPQQRQKLRVDAVCLGLDRYLVGLDARIARMAPPQAAKAGRMTLASATIDPDAGILRNVVVMAGGVEAAGKFVMLDGSGKRTLDPAKARRRLPVWTDARSLHSLLAAVAEVGGRLKTRVDHNDSIEARAGYADNFRLVGADVVCDLHLNASFSQRDAVLEIATRTPELMGISISFDAAFELENDRAFMRVLAVDAADLVDEGAVTPGGLFCQP
jgi:hypothetical protein